MAANAFILVNADPTSTEEVVKKLAAIPGAVVHEVLGPYDFVVDLEADTQEDITAILRNKIRPINGVTNTVTCICF
ncbi:MAG: AsnC family transcriptional regulator [Dehalococcoidia bacterium]|nr:AsnC family transcriptional regulator [Dehalococcoidia bacterium]|tara:strand:+ start:239 stop:466 length:228 start_codon:yes stop_codon:yes gene_type:complete